MALRAERSWLAKAFVSRLPGLDIRTSGFWHRMLLIRWICNAGRRPACFRILRTASSAPPVPGRICVTVTPGVIWNEAVARVAQSRWLRTPGFGNIAGGLTEIRADLVGLCPPNVHPAPGKQPEASLACPAPFSAWADTSL